MDFIKKALQLIFIVFSFYSSLAQIQIGGFYRFGQLNAGMSNPWFSSKKSNMGAHLKYYFHQKMNIKVCFDKQLISENSINITYLDKHQWKLSSSHFIYANLKNDLAPIYNHYYTSRFNFTHQFHIKKQLSKRIHVKFSPTLVHFNLVNHKEIAHDQFYLGSEFTKRLGRKSYVLIKYFLPMQQYLEESSNFLKIAYVFPIHNSKLEFSLSNHLSSYITENSALTEAKWNQGAVNLGIKYLYFLNKKS